MKCFFICMSVLLLFATVALTAQQNFSTYGYYDGDGHVDSWLLNAAGGNPWVLFLFEALEVLFWIAVVVAIVLFAKKIIQKRGLLSDRSAIKVVKERYARGEIDGETMRKMENDLRG